MKSKRKFKFINFLNLVGVSRRLVFKYAISTTTMEITKKSIKDGDLAGLFFWEDTPEGYVFWKNLNNLWEEMDGAINAN